MSGDPIAKRDLKTMAPEAIQAALAEGRLDHLLGSATSGGADQGARTGTGSLAEVVAGWDPSRLAAVVASDQGMQLLADLVAEKQRRQ